MSRAKSSREFIALATRAREGDDQALEKLLGEVHVHIRRFFHQWLHRRRGWEDLVDDLAQEALIKIARGIATCGATTDAMLMEWCRMVAMNAGKDYLRGMSDEWEVSAFRDETELRWTLDSSPWESEIEEDPGERIMLGLLREAHEAEGEEAQTLLWHRLVQKDEWAATGGALGIPHTAAKRRFQRMQGRIRHAVLKKLVALAPDELTAVRRWIMRIDLSDEEIMSFPSTRSVPHGDA
jgi:DNA-directed RNA polymerase specialized sigma24 family protein